MLDSTCFDFNFLYLILIMKKKTIITICLVIVILKYTWAILLFKSLSHCYCGSISSVLRYKTVGNRDSACSNNKILCNLVGGSRQCLVFRECLATHLLCYYYLPSYCLTFVTVDLAGLGNLLISCGEKSIDLLLV